MRAIPIIVDSDNKGWLQLVASFRKNWIHYLQEALGLAIFMISACLFGALLEANNSSLHHLIGNDLTRMIIMGLLMGATALFIFYSRFTSPSGSHINPAVSLVFYRLGKLCHWDLMFYCLSQFIGGTLAVYLMQILLGNILIAAPVNSVATLPGKTGSIPALAIEVIIAFTTMMMVLITSQNEKWKKYSRIISGCLVCTWVIVAGPVSGFGMNPARSFASALPAHCWKSFWIYLLAPVAGMLLAAETYLLINRKK